MCDNISTPRNIGTSRLKRGPASRTLAKKKLCHKTTQIEQLYFIYFLHFLSYQSSFKYLPSYFLCSSSYVLPYRQATSRLRSGPNREWNSIFNNSCYENKTTVISISSKLVISIVITFLFRVKMVSMGPYLVINGASNCQHFLKLGFSFETINTQKNTKNTKNGSLLH